MKIKIKLLIILTLTFFYLTSCETSGSVPYSLAGTDSGTETAILTFGQGVSFVDFERQVFPEGTRYASVLLPAGRPLEMRVYVYWNGDVPGNRRRGIFRCPPLEAGSEYRLRFVVRTKGIFIETPIDGYSIALERKTETRTFFGPRSNYEAVYTQVIPLWPQ